ncbi:MULTISPECIES: TrkA family potassium uptake protein [Clostridium]|uniref:TrkA family potassium uptake protein n=1 Tax=Clostridium aquiflavi TaxID=3073603 RepID=A0ABU1EEB6_9CLOT|nr:MULTISPECIES: TrkA family potassium uptake protein [unclassified Clostridium]MDR5586728.1 TrkA family potassium uptake protein [Clostridium sp. 5N-1]NFG62308.1 TrkA family potassium uptake protein [Clostridium botulinum]NFQ09655.1 TrkA family potassium uptake protein [Clostridium botulinum]
MVNKQFVVIGLGRFGASVAKTLYDLGNDVLVIDKDEDIIQDISDNVTHAVQMDSTDENALRTLGLRNFDVAIVTIGSNIQASIMATLLVKELGVKYIIAKANNKIHSKVLYKIGADRVILPEQDMGVRVAHNLVSSSILDYIELSSDYSIMEIEALDEWDGKSLREIKLRSQYGINVMAIKEGEDINISPSADHIVKAKDIIVAIGSAEDLSKLEGMIVRLK